ncbi:MAG: alpha/beta hydrolase, partial [Bacteroidota bacterium]
GPLPLAANWDETSVTNTRNTYEAIFRDCAVDPACAKKHPSLRERFYAFLEGLTKDPILLTIPLPDGKDSTSYTVTGKEVFALLGDVSSAEIPRVPALLENLLAGDLTMLEEVGTGRLQMGTGSGLGMRLSVWCAEELIFADPARVARERTRYPEITGAEPTVFRYEVCRAWNVRPELLRENQPVTSDIPTLLLSGGYDPITPPAWAEEMRATLSNALHLVFPGWTHGVTTYWDNPCGMDVARAFFNDPSGPLSTNCLDQLSPVVFE